MDLSISEYFAKERRRVKQSQLAPIAASSFGLTPVRTWTLLSTDFFCSKSL